MLENHTKIKTDREREKKVVRSEGSEPEEPEDISFLPIMIPKQEILS